MYGAQITLIEPLGAQHIVWLAVNRTTTLAAVLDSDWKGEVGSRVYWGVGSDRVSLFDARTEQRI